MKQFNQITLGISDRSFGSIKEKGIIHSLNLKKFLTQVEIKTDKVVFPRQVHGNKIHEVYDNSLQIVPNADGLITRQKQVFIAVATADCLPVFFYDLKKSYVGVLHAGYKGILKGIIEKMVDLFLQKGSSKQDINVGIGPGIGVCCYDIPKEREFRFRKRFPKLNGFIKYENDKVFLNLKEIARQIITNKGIPERNLEILPYCTKCYNKIFYSYRGDSRETFGEFVSVIGIK